MSGMVSIVCFICSTAVCTRSLASSMVSTWSRRVSSIICSISCMAWLTRLRMARSMNTSRNLASASLSSRFSIALDSARLLARVGLQVIVIVSGVSLMLFEPSTVMHLSKLPLNRKLMG